MHEMSLVRTLLRQVEQLCEQHGGSAVEQIEIEIGPLSGVEAILVREAFNALVPQTCCAGSELVIQEIPLKAICLDCEAEVTLAAFDFVCDACGSRSLQVTQGDAFRLRTVTVQSNEAVPD